MKTDIVIVGCGGSGLFTALNLPNDKKITVITKSRAEECDSFLAQGGICVKRDENDFWPFYYDTQKAGHLRCDPLSVKIMIERSREIINDLISFGAEFEKKDGELAYTREGAHSKPRILYSADKTGEAITSKLLSAVKSRDNITLLEHTSAVDLIADEDFCKGVICKDKNGEFFGISADYTILATGGIGGLFKHSTNYPHLTGDGLAFCLGHGVRLKNIDYIQIHPTTLYTKNKGRSFLISESVRGEGAILLDKNGNRFTDELQPRDVVTKEIYRQMKKDGTDHVFLSLAPIPKEEILSHFPTIYKRCLEEGYDITKEPIPVVPAQHYFMGGIEVDQKSRTEKARLYAVGETACNGVHGKNRLASNSLLESLVFAKAAAEDIAFGYSALPDGNEPEIYPEKYENSDEKYKELVLKAIEKEKKTDMNNISMTVNADELILLALKEDITSEDITTASVMPEYKLGEVSLICKQDGIIAGLKVFERVFTLLDPQTLCEFTKKDGDEVKCGELIGRVTGDIRVLLSGERTALNYLQRMSGIATYTKSIVKLLEGSGTRLLDTRKTTPNMRVFEKYSVKVGGGCNHRYNLSDGILLKDNHIGAAGSVKRAVEMAKEYAPFVRKIEVEVENLDMLKEALEAGADIIMLDNMSVEDMKEAVKLAKGKAETECSGNVTKENIARLTEIGVDYISSGALTHSAPILDLSLKNLHAI